METTGSVEVQGLVSMVSSAQSTIPTLWLHRILAPSVPVFRVYFCVILHRSVCTLEMMHDDEASSPHMISFCAKSACVIFPGTRCSSPVSRHIVLMHTNVINLLNRVPEHDSLTFFVLHRTKCKLMGAFLHLFRAVQNAM